MQNNNLETYLKKILDNLPNSIVITDPSKKDNPIIYVNKKFTEIFEYTFEEVLGENCRLLQKDDREQTQLQELRVAIENKNTISLTLRNYTKSGTLIHNQLTIFPIFKEDLDEVAFFIGMQKDISISMITKQHLTNSIYNKLPKKENYTPKDISSLVEELSIYESELLAQNNELISKERELESLNIEFSSLFQNAPIIFFLVDEQLEIKRFNKIADEYFKFSSSRLVVKSLFSLVKKENIEKLIYWINNNDYLSESIDIDMICAKNTIRKFKLGAKPYSLNSNWLILSIIDIQEEFEIKQNLEDMVEKKTKETIEQNKLIQKQSQLASMGEMIDAIAHQWLNPLTIIRLITQDSQYVLQNKTSRDSQKVVLENLEKTVKQLDHLKDTLQEFRSFFRPNKNIESASIRTLIKSILVILKDELVNNRIDIDIDHVEDINIDIIINEFKHVILNLITNSRDAFIENEIENRKIVIETLKLEDKVVIKFSDNAGGISEHVINKIFEPNFTTKAQGMGTGIGLYICKQILEKLDSKISVVNKNNGACFKVTVPFNS